MKAFHFRLTTLQKLREAERQRRQLELAQALEAERILNDQIAEIRREIAAAKNSVREKSQPGEINVDALLELQRYGLQLRAQALTLAQQLEQVRVETERRRQVLVEADRQVQTLDKLRDQQWQTHQREELHREQKIIDEMAQKRTAQEART